MRSNSSFWTWTKKTWLNIEAQIQTNQTVFLLCPKKLRKPRTALPRATLMDTSLISNCTVVFMAPEKGQRQRWRANTMGEETRRKPTCQTKYTKIYMWNLLDSSRFIYLDSNLNHDSAWFVNGFKHFAKSFQTSSVSNWKLLSFLFDLSFARKRHARFRHTAFIGRNFPSILPGQIFMFPQLRGQLLQKMSTCSIRIKWMIGISGFFSTTSAHE